MYNDEFETVLEEDDFNKYVERAKKESKWNDFKIWIKTKWNKIMDWFGSKSLTEVLQTASIIGAIIGVIFKAIKSCRKTGTERLADQRDFGFYDPHTGIRWDLKRKMTNNEKHELRIRMEAGEPCEEVLKELGVYKYK